MKVDNVIIDRDSTGKSRGCAFVTMRWKEFHMSNTLYDRDKDSAVQDQGWSSLLTNIMNQQLVVVTRSTSNSLEVRDGVSAFRSRGCFLPGVSVIARQSCGP